MNKYILIIFVVLIMAWVFGAHNAFSEAPESGEAEKSSKDAKDKHEFTPQFVTVKVNTENYITGKTETLEVELALAEEFAEQLQWDKSASKPFIRVEVPKHSGLRFQSPKDDKDSDWTGLATSMTFELPENNKGKLTAKTDFMVQSRTKSTTYDFRIDVTAPVIQAGKPMLDTGTVKAPFKVDTPLRTKIIVLLLIAFVIFMFIVEWVRVDVVAIIMMVSLPLLDLLHSRQTFTGLSSNAVVAIIGVMIVSAGLNKVGLVSQMVKPILKLAGKSASRIMIFLSGAIAAISSVMQNTGAAVLFLPAIQQACKEIKTPVSRILMPIGMCAILGGTMTMIGTSPLILLNDLLPEDMEPFGLLELTPIGAALVVGGIIYFSTLGFYILSKRSSGQTEEESADKEHNLEEFYSECNGPFEIRIPADYKLSETVVDVRRNHHVNIVAISSKKLEKRAPAPDVKLTPNTSLCVFGIEENIKKYVDDRGFALKAEPDKFVDLFNTSVAGTIEAIITPHSRLIGKTIKDIRFRKTYGVTTLALLKNGVSYFREMADLPLASGDTMLLHGRWERLESLSNVYKNFVFISPVHQNIQEPEKSKYALASFIVALSMMIFSSFYFQGAPYNPIQLSVCLMTGALLMILTGVIKIGEAYRAVDWRTVFLLGGLIPLGMAVDYTGTAEWLAKAVVAALGDSVTPLILLIVLAALSCVFCLVISNVGACTLLVPLGMSMALQIGVDPRVAAIVVGLGVSNSFILPTHQVNALYMGPGGYRTKDYLTIGSVMSVLYIVILVAMTYVFYL